MYSWTTSDTESLATSFEIPRITRIIMSCIISHFGSLASGGDRKNKDFMNRYNKIMGALVFDKKWFKPLNFTWIQISYCGI